MAKEITVDSSKSDTLKSLKQKMVDFIKDTVTLGVLALTGSIKLVTPTNDYIHCLIYSVILLLSITGCSSVVFEKYYIPDGGREWEKIEEHDDRFSYSSYASLVSLKYPRNFTYVSCECNNTTVLVSDIYAPGSSWVALGPLFIPIFPFPIDSASEQSETDIVIELEGRTCLDEMDGSSISIFLPGAETCLTPKTVVALPHREAIRYTYTFNEKWSTIKEFRLDFIKPVLGCTIPSILFEKKHRVAYYPAWFIPG